MKRGDAAGTFLGAVSACVSARSAHDKGEERTLSLTLHACVAVGARDWTACVWPRVAFVRPLGVERARSGGWRRSTLAGLAQCDLGTQPYRQCQLQASRCVAMVLCCNVIRCVAT